MNLFSNKVTIIAEVGTNHNGDIDTALQLIEIGADCGADVVKFQSFMVDELLAAGDHNYDTLKKLEIPEEWYILLMEHCKKKGVLFLSTATNFTTLNWMERYGARAYKIASCNITHRPLIDRLIEIGKPVIISTGLATIDEILELDDYLKSRHFTQYAFLHCVSQYPARPEDLRLKNIEVLKELFSCPIGFSDHSIETHMAVAAVSLGATIIEKHISLDKKGIGLDHKVAILPDEFRSMCRAIRDVERALYANTQPNEEGIRTMRRSLHYVRDMSPGTIIQNEGIKIVRPEDGLLPKELNKVIGKKLAKAVRENQPVLLEDLENDDRD